MLEAMGEYDFEFERKFFLRQLPAEVLQEPAPSLIIQGYFLCVDGLALRIRLQADNVKAEAKFLPAGPKGLLEAYLPNFSFAALTAKGPNVNGTRYEVERELDIDLAVHMLRRCQHLICKHRYSLWYGADGWVIDEFLGENYPLIVAEVERDEPVTNLEVPEFCVSEVTSDYRFTNDSLVKYPYCQWQQRWEQFLEKNGGFILGIFDNKNQEEGEDPSA